MRYQIWSNESYKLREKPIPGYAQFLDGYRPDALMRMTFEGDIFSSVESKESAIDALHELFARFNQDDRPNGGAAHSLSVGDVIKINDEAWSVDVVNFTKLDRFEPVARQEGVERA